MTTTEPAKSLTSPQQALGAMDARRLLETTVLSAVLALACFATGRLGLSVATASIGTTTVWAPAGIALAALLLWGYRVWPGVLLGAFLVHLSASGSAGAALGLALGSTLGAVSGAYFVNRFAHGAQVFDALSDVVRFIGLIALSGTVAATMGVASLALAGFAAPGRLGELWLTAWVGEVAGSLLLTPLLVLWVVGPPLAWTRRLVLEAVLIVLCALLLNLALFAGLFAPLITTQPLEALCLVPVLWAAFRLGARAPLLTVFVTSRIAIWGTLHGFGPFLAADIGASLLFVQVYFGVVTVLALMLVAIVADRRRGETRHAQLLLREQDARTQAELNADKVVRLQRVTAALSEALSAAQVAQTVLKQGLPALGAVAGMIVELDGASEELVSLGSVGYPEEISAAFRRIPLTAETPLSEAVRAGHSVTVPTNEERITRYPLLASMPRNQGLGALACLPLSIEQRIIGGLSLTFGAERAFAPEELRLMQAFAQLSSQALERARLYESERTARAQAEVAGERLALLAEASSVLASSLDYHATLAQVAHMLVPRHGDWCALHMLAADGTSRLLEAAHVDPHKLSLVLELSRRYPSDPLVPGGLHHVLSTGHAEYMSEVPRRLMLATARDAEHEQLLDALGLSSYLIVPLTAGEQVLGAISLATAESGRHYEAADVALIEELAQRAALAIENARLYGEAQRAAAELEVHVRARTAQLQATNTLLETEIAERTRAQAVLQESEERFRLLVDNVADYAIIMLDPEGSVMSWNEGAQRILGYTAEEVTGRSVALFYPPEDVAAGEPEQLLRRAARDGQAKAEGWRIRKGGAPFWADVLVTALRDPQGRLRGFSKVTRDSTERKRAAEALQAANAELERRVQERTLELQEVNRRQSEGFDDLMERNRAVGQLSEMGTLLQGCLDTTEAYHVLSQFGPRLFPLDSGALYLFTAARDLLEPVAWWGDARLAQRVFVPNDCWALRRGHMHVVHNPRVSPLCAHLGEPDAPPDPAALPPLSYACVPLSAQGETLGVMHLRRSAERTSAHPLSEAEQHLMGAMVEQAALALSNLKLREILRVQSIRDPLTGLFNRRYMEETLEREIHHAARQHHSIGIALLDIDRFKQFNDRLGHQVGDIVLRAVGDFLNANVRGEDIACRYGGEEFMLIMQEASLSDTCRRAEQLRIDIKSAIGEHYQERFGPVSVSIGVAVFPTHGTSIEKLVRAADSALYRAKAGGRDRVEAAADEEH